jgi:hypothetical protein
MTKDEALALDLALEALERLDGWLALRYGSGLTPQEQQVITAIKQARSAPVQEPVALVIDGVLVKYSIPKKYTGSLYTTPPAAQRPDVDALVALARADEREACAKVAEDMDSAVLVLFNVTRQPKVIASAIRARGNT